MQFNLYMQENQLIIFIVYKIPSILVTELHIYVNYVGFQS